MWDPSSWELSENLENRNFFNLKRGHSVVQSIEVLRCNPEGRGFDYR